MQRGQIVGHHRVKIRHAVVGFGGQQSNDLHDNLRPGRVIKVEIKIDAIRLSGSVTPPGARCSGTKNPRSNVTSPASNDREVVAAIKNNCTVAKSTLSQDRRCRRFQR